MVLVNKVNPLKWLNFIFLLYFLVISLSILLNLPLLYFIHIAYIVDLRAGSSSFTRLPSMEGKRVSAACGAIFDAKKNETRLIVAGGGEQSSEVLQISGKNRSNQ